MAPAVATYEPRDPSCTVLYKVIAEHLETFLVSLDADPDAKGLPAYVQREFYDYLQCGILAHGFLRLGCDTCKQEVLLAFSCKRRGFCPSCAGRRMAQTAAHLVESIIPWVPTRQWVVSVPMLCGDQMRDAFIRGCKVFSIEYKVAPSDEECYWCTASPEGKKHHINSPL